MAQRRFHYEQAFEHYLRANRLPYVAVDEARKSLIEPMQTRPDGTLKSFDFVLYGKEHNQLVDVKGRKCRIRKPRVTSNSQNRLTTQPLFPQAPPRQSVQIGSLESWVTEDDIASLTEWERLFGSGFHAYFVFLYWCEAQPPDALFQEIFEFKERWYALRAVPLEAYRSHMRVRSPKWKTWSIPTAAFAEISVPVRSLHASLAP